MCRRIRGHGRVARGDVICSMGLGCLVEGGGCWGAEVCHFWISLDCIDFTAMVVFLLKSLLFMYLGCSDTKYYAGKSSAPVKSWGEFQTEARTVDLRHTGKCRSYVCLR
jgi:hypothetical protein